MPTLNQLKALSQNAGDHPDVMALHALAEHIDKRAIRKQIKEDAGYCWRWMKSLGITEIPFIGPFADQWPEPGDPMTVKVDSEVFRHAYNNAVGYITRKSVQIEVLRVEPGSVRLDLFSPEGYVVVDSQIFWHGKGGSTKSTLATNLHW